MKYKRIYLVSVCVVLAATFFISMGVNTKSSWEHQHQSGNDKSEKTQGTIAVAKEDFSSHLPVVTIDTRSQTIPGLSREKDLITTSLKIYDGAGDRNSLSDHPAVSIEANIKYRGNSSLHFDKKSYLVKFVDEYGEDKKSKVMGMPEHSTWVLNGPFLDRTMMRNYLCMNVSAEIMGYAPRVRYCELFVDGDYKGVYLMMETVSYGADRVNVTKYKDGDIVSSYILRADRGDEPLNELNQFSEYTMRMPADTEKNKYALTVEYPSKSSLTHDLKETIEKDFSRFEKALYSFDYDDEVYGASSFVNINSFVDYFIINEFFQNYDAGIYSTYFHKDVRDKIYIGPVWDFNNACNNYMDTSYDGTGFGLYERTWYHMLMKDDSFTDSIIGRYKSLRTTFLNEEYLLHYIDDVQAYLGDAVDRNYSVWGYSFDVTKVNGENKLYPDERNYKSYEEAVSQLKEFIVNRGRWMDEYIENLSQYSHESKIKPY